MKNITFQSHGQRANIDLVKLFGMSRHLDSDTSKLYSFVDDEEALYKLISNPDEFAKQHDVEMDERFKTSLNRTLDLGIVEGSEKTTMQANPGGSVAVARVVGGAVLSAMVSKDLSVVEPDVAGVGADDFV